LTSALSTTREWFPALRSLVMICGYRCSRSCGRVVVYVYGADVYVLFWSCSSSPACRSKGECRRGDSCHGVHS
jgi:hypothetical protein